MLAWGLRVTPTFRTLVVTIAQFLGVDPSWVMACIAFESARTFSPTIRNPYTGAVGLIQFMPQTAAGLSTSIELLAGMTALQQLSYVLLYFKPYQGKLKNLGDVYMAILWPGGIGKPDDYVLFDASSPNHPKQYLQNKGLDIDHDGHITRLECYSHIQALLTEGLLPQNAASL